MCIKHQTHTTELLTVLHEIELDPKTQEAIAKHLWEIFKSFTLYMRYGGAIDLLGHKLFKVNNSKLEQYVARVTRSDIAKDVNC